MGVGKAPILSALGGAIVFRSKSAIEMLIKSRSGNTAQMGHNILTSHVLSLKP